MIEAVEEKLELAKRVFAGIALLVLLIVAAVMFQERMEVGRLEAKEHGAISFDRNDPEKAIPALKKYLESELPAERASAAKEIGRYGALAAPAAPSCSVGSPRLRRTFLITTRRWQSLSSRLTASRGFSTIRK